MDERNSVKERLAVDFETKHHAFLSELKQMPVSTEEEKEKRWAFFRSYPLHDDFQIEVMEAYKPGIYCKLRRRLNDAHLAWEQDCGQVSYLNRELDWMIFCEAVKKAICSYTGENKAGNSYSFLAAVGQFYKNEAWKEKAKNMLGDMGVSDTERADRSKAYIIKLFSIAENMKQKSGGMESLEKILKDALEKKEETGKSHTYTKKEQELVKELLKNKTFVYLDETTGENGSTLKNIQPDERDMYQEVLDREAGIPFLESFCRDIEENWENIKSAKGLREREIIKVFFTRDILKVLKLDNNGKPYLEEPAGDEEFYRNLEPRGEFLYGKVFYKEYLHRAFVEDPEDFYKVYAKLLRSEFDFSDRILAEVSRKDPGTISRQRSRYRELMGVFYNYYRNMD